MVRVDVDQRSVESHRAFIESDQNSDLERGDVVDRDRDGFAAALEKRLACAQQESLQIVAGTNARFHGNAGCLTVFFHFDERHKEIVKTVPKLLNKRVLVGAAFVAVHRDPLMDFFAVQIQRFAQRFHDQLLQVSGKQL